MRIALMGGGTAGHLFPSVAVAQRLLNEPDTEVLFIGAQGRLDGPLLEQLNLRHELIPARQFPYKPSLELVRALHSLVQGTLRCQKILRKFKADVVFGAGGYVSVAGVIAASRSGIPTVCHASDAHPDRANRLLSRWATQVTCHFEAATQYFPAGKTTIVGQPVRQEFFQTNREQARQALGLAPGDFVLIVAGGSQGARTLNQATVGALPELLKDPNFHVLHLTGAREFEANRAGAQAVIGDNPQYRCIDFYSEPWNIFHAADLGLIRAGASSIAETTITGLPLLVVPYPFAGGHQRLNAIALAQAQAAIMQDNENCTTQWLLSTIKQLRETPGQLEKMRTAALKITRPDAAESIVKILHEVAKV